MNAAELDSSENERHALLGQLSAAEAALRANLHRHGLEPTARAHMARALSHIREAYVAVNEGGRARTVQQLVDELTKVERLFDKLRQQPAPAVVVKPIHV
jgi:hypothetical protein